ncbi:unnamed protein product [Arabis nemorensis]|uniref:Uncharacterized protein n=1 Tax=Arabis nemorensis TaxID=586526 RepID=A0A565CNG0_9BRAS|nr:unnamed protein product [Arabis nemorensis]
MDMSWDMYVSICGLVNEVHCRTLLAVVMFFVVVVERRVGRGGGAICSPLLVLCSDGGEQ